MANPVVMRTNPDAVIGSHAGWPMRTLGANQHALTRLRPAKINFYLKVMRKLGFRADQVLAGTGITGEDLADPLYLVEVSKYIRIISNLHQLSGSRSLAFTLGEQLTLGDLGILGYSVMTCDDSDQATRVWHQFNPIFFGNLIEMGWENVGDRVLLTYLPYSDIRGELLQFLIEEKICCDMALQRLIGIEKFPVARLTLSYPAPHYVDCYRKLTDCPIEFHASRSTMLLTDDALSIPLRGGDSETHRQCTRLLTDMFNSVNSGSMASLRVRAILEQNLRTHPTVADVADRMHFSARTLNRKLEKEGFNFSDLVIAVRREAVENLLATTDLDGSQIADRVGFADVRSLRRFFKAHTGKTIQQFRSDTLGNASANA